ncbi:MAG TPA: signal recognition particle subunit SRP19/SEC65 family protein [Conexivisphaerales archaeon]|nr:signal recognition particle subunit SRP19/SEC65 family protein [Conexivisphaerales archaeon]
MKDYGKQVFWLDYFDSALSREEGRRVSLPLATRGPTVDELAQAARRLGYEPHVEKARHPARPTKPSGYIQIAKKAGKKVTLLALAKSLAEGRAQQRK